MSRQRRFYGWGLILLSLALLGAAMPRQVFARPPVLVRLPTRAHAQTRALAPIMLRAIVAPPQRAAREPWVITSPYQGTVRTVPVQLQNAGPIAYDALHDAFYIPYFSGRGPLLARVTAAGSISQMAVLPNSPIAMTFDPHNGLIYIVDQFNFRVLSISQEGQISLVAGGTSGTSDGTGPAAQFQRPQGITFNPRDHKLYLADVDRVRVISESGVVTTLTPANSFGPPNSFSFANFPEGIAYDVDNNTFYVTDTYQDKIWSVSATGLVTYLTGQCLMRTSNCDLLQRDGSFAVALFGTPTSVVYDSTTRSLYVVDGPNNQIRQLTPIGPVATLAGGGAIGKADGIGILATFTTPSSITLDTRNGLLYVSDTGNATIRSIVANGPKPPPPTHGIAMYDPPTAESGPNGIAIGSDGSVWFTEQIANKIGRRLINGSFVEYSVPANVNNLGRIVRGGDGNLWFADTGPGGGINSTGEISKITNAGLISEYPLPIGGAYATDLVLAADGNVWFVDSFGGIGFVTQAGDLTEFTFPSESFIANGKSNTFWVSSQNEIDQLSTSLSTLRRVVAQLQPGPLTLGPDGDMWFSQPDGIGTITSVSVFEFLLPPPPNGFSRKNADIVVGHDGALWFAEPGTGGLGRITTTGIYSDRIVPAPRAGPFAAVVAADGSIWFTDPGSHKIGRSF